MKYALMQLIINSNELWRREQQSCYFFQEIVSLDTMQTYCFSIRLIYVVSLKVQTLASASVLVSVAYFRGIYIPMYTHITLVVYNRKPEESTKNIYNICEEGSELSTPFTFTILTTTDTTAWVLALPLWFAEGNVIYLFFCVSCVY